MAGQHKACEDSVSGKSGEHAGGGHVLPASHYYVAAV